MATASTGSRESFSVFGFGCMQVVVMYRLIKKPLTTKKFAVICCRIEIGTKYGISAANLIPRLF
jgi:hypothetical protein